MHKPDLTSRVVLRGLAQRFHVTPSKEHSQNFLLDRSVVHNMAQEAGIGKGNWVLEVGAGFGILTEALLATGADVLAFEIDENLAAALVTRFRGEKRFQLIVGDFFRWYQEHARDLSAKPFSIVANLPYHASAHFFATVLSGSVQPLAIVVMLQKEVAKRIAARPGAMTLLGVSVQYFGEPRVLQIVPKSVFWPEPEVDSAVLMVERIHRGGADAERLFCLARMAFANRRKQLHNSLAAGLHRTSVEVSNRLTTSGIDPSIRPQDLTLAEWRILTKTFPVVTPSNPASGVR